MLINSRMLIDNLYTRMSMSSTTNYGDPSTYHICTYIQTYTLQQQKYALVYATITLYFIITILPLLLHIVDMCYTYIHMYMSV